MIIAKEHFDLYLKECTWRFINDGIKFYISIFKQSIKDCLI